MDTCARHDTHPRPKLISYPPRVGREVGPGPLSTWGELNVNPGQVECQPGAGDLRSRPLQNLNTPRLASHPSRVRFEVGPGCEGLGAGDIEAREGA